jgi:hypothetical protein
LPTLSARPKEICGAWKAMTEDQVAEFVDAIEDEITESFLSMKSEIQMPDIIPRIG